MADQPKVLRLADGLQHQAAWERHYGPSHLRDLLLQSEAELRRLHDIEKAYKSACDIVEEQDKKLVELEALNQELLEALKRIKQTGVFIGAIAQEMMDAAIAKTEGQQ